VPPVFFHFTDGTPPPFLTGLMDVGKVFFSPEGMKKFPPLHLDNDHPAFFLTLFPFPFRVFMGRFRHVCFSFPMPFCEDSFLFG